MVRFSNSQILKMARRDVIVEVQFWELKIFKSLTILKIFFNTSNFGILKMMERNLGISNRDLNKN